MGAALLELDKLTKRYGPVAAVKDAGVAFEAGLIHLVCGENGAGKSTLLKMGGGIVAPDSGRVLIAGKELAPHTPAAALDRGVAMVTQHFALAPALTVLENIALTAVGRFDLRRLRADVIARQRALGFSLPLDARVSELSVGDKQRTEIVRALLRDARVLVLDEPTAILVRAEVRSLYALLRTLADSGKAIIVVSHKMDEVEAFADRVSVMRRGELLWTRDVPRNADPSDLKLFVSETVREIMGETAVARDRARALVSDKDAPLLSVKDLAALSLASFEVRAGEIVGVAGVEGNGQAELVSALADADGDPNIAVLGAPKNHGDISFVHEDRQTMGLVLEASAAENLMLGDFAECEHRGLIDEARLSTKAAARAKAVAFTRGLDVLAGELSGGNQQKLVVGRALGRAAAKVLVFVHPTRGVDIGAAREIHDRIVEAAARGLAVLVVSADADELREICDRILVVAKRTIVREFPPTVSDEDLGVAMLSSVERDDAKSSEASP